MCTCPSGTFSRHSVMSLIYSHQLLICVRGIITLSARNTSTSSVKTKQYSMMFFQTFQDDIECQLWELIVISVTRFNCIQSWQSRFTLNVESRRVVAGRCHGGRCLFVFVGRAWVCRVRLDFVIPHTSSGRIFVFDDPLYYSLSLANTFSWILIDFNTLRCSLAVPFVKHVMSISDSESSDTKAVKLHENKIYKRLKAISYIPC